MLDGLERPDMMANTTAPTMKARLILLPRLSRGSVRLCKAFIKDAAFSGSFACCDNDWRDNYYLQLALIVPFSIRNYIYFAN